MKVQVLQGVAGLGHQGSPTRVQEAVGFHLKIDLPSANAPLDLQCLYLPRRCGVPRTSSRFEFQAFELGNSHFESIRYSSQSRYLDSFLSSRYLL